MRKLIVVAALLLGTWRVQGQEGKVIVLRDDDAQHAKEAWNRLQYAEAEWQSIIDGDTRRYLVVPEGHADAGNLYVSDLNVRTSTSCSIIFAPDIEALKKCREEQEEDRRKTPAKVYRKGFEQGFQFSSDFKYIVPKPVANLTGAGGFTLPPSFTLPLTVHCNKNNTIC